VKYTTSVFLTCAVAVGLAANAFAQTNLEFTRIVQTAEGSIQLTWSSINHEVYEIDEADALGTNADGSTQWNMLYSRYPSQGTNTFWLDTGNYFDVPPIVRPMYSPARFYRIVDLGPDTTSDEPVIAITSPTNGFVASNTLTITVSAISDQPTLSTKLYVDGQEMSMAVETTNNIENGTNNITNTYVINTCEWLNGPHTLFATATCCSALTGPDNVGPIYTGHAVSPFATVTFDNLITGVSFSQAFFDPAAGQTQQVTAVFAANVNWTLDIQDVNSNTVRSTNGSGISMQFNWDGNGTGETNLPAGVYTYLLQAQTNGAPYNGGGGGSGGGGGGNGGGGPPPLVVSSGFPVNAGDSTADGWQTLTIPLPPAPPGLSYGTDENGNEITNMTIEVPAAQFQSQPSSMTFSPEGGPLGGGNTPAPAASQQTQAPTRPPTASVRGTVGTFGVAYDTYVANGANGFKLYAPDNGLGIGERVQLEGLGGDTPLTYDYILSQEMANNFVWEMEHAGWNSRLNLVDNQLTTSSLTGSETPFNQVNLGVLMDHGTYGTSLDYSANSSGCLQMYFPITSGDGAQYVRMSQMYFGGYGTNGLKWMAIFACHSLYHTDWSSMQSQQVKPYNSNLHLLLGYDSECFYSLPYILAFWAKYMTHGNSTNYSPMTIRAAWYQAANHVYSVGGNYGTTITCAVAGDTACQNDTLQTNSNTTGTWTYESKEVWPTYTP
jgi:hypothetical protein